MPSKRKKNKRRMRRVQAQRRLLEEQHAACPPVKASPAIAVGAPGTITKKAAKTPKPAPPKVPEVVPIAVSIVETPKIIPKVEPPKEKPVPEPTPVAVVSEPVPEPVPEPVLEQTPAEVEIPAPVVTEAPAPVVIETPVIETPPEEPAKVEVAFVQEDEEEEPIIPVPEPIAEVTLPAEAEVPVAAPAETQVIKEEPPIEITETEQDVPAPVVDVPVVQDTFPDPSLAEAPEPVSLAEEVLMDSADVMVDDFVITDSTVEVIEPKTIELLPVFEKPTVAVCEIFGSGPAVTIPEPELVTPTEETLDDVAAEKCLDLGEPVSEKCEMPCQIQLSAESVQLTSMEMSVEAALNGHIVPELSIES